MIKFILYLPFWARVKLLFGCGLDVFIDWDKHHVELKTPGDNTSPIITMRNNE